MDAAGCLNTLLTDRGRKEPFAHYARLHEMGPVARFSKKVSGYDAVVHGYEEADKALRDPRFLQVDAEVEDKSGSLRNRHPVLRTLWESTFFINGPQHARLRRMFGNVFTARRVNALEPAITRITDEALERLAGACSDSECADFMSEFAFPVPANVMGELLGVPEEDRTWYRKRAKAIGDVLDFNVDFLKMRAADKAAVEATAYMTDLVARRRAEPRDDLITMLAQAQADGTTAMSDTELHANLITLFNAGFVTTTHVFGNGLVLLLDRPALLAQVRDDPKLAAGCVEETLRVEPPTHFVARYTSVDCEVAGVELPQGSKVIILLGAANRDPRRFPDPDVFDPGRKANQPLSFGAGMHYCLGAALGRVEGQMGFQRLFARFPDIAIAATPPTPRQLTLRGYDTLSVRVA